MIKVSQRKDADDPNSRHSRTPQRIVLFLLKPINFEPTNAGGVTMLAAIQRGSKATILPPVSPDVSPAKTPSLRASCGEGQ